MPPARPLPRLTTFAAVSALAAVLAACASAEPPPPTLSVVALTADQALLRFAADRPQQVTARQPVRGLPPGEQLVGLDFRVAQGRLYALAASGRLYTVDPDSGAAAAVGPAASLPPLDAAGFDFNPAADRIRVVAGAHNLRLHPDTGALVDGAPLSPGADADPPLAYAAGDRYAGQHADVVAAAYTYHPQDDKLTTNYAIDRRLGVLVTQGSKAGAAPVVSPNTGRLFTVGELGTGALLDAALDIADDRANTALAAVRSAAQPATQLLRVDLASGRAQTIGRIGDGAPLLGIAIEP